MPCINATGSLTQPEKKHDRRGKLVGKIRIIFGASQDNPETKDAWVAGQDLYKKLMCTPVLHPITSTESSLECDYSVVCNKIDEIQNGVTEGAVSIEVEFSLYRSGECNFVVDKKDIEQICKPVDDPAEVARMIVRHAFIFLKDLTHRHYHHHRLTDQKIDVYQSHGDDRLWRRETLYGLVRMALQARRANTIEAYKNAIGVLAYAKCFQDHLAGWFRNYQNGELEFAPREHFIPYDFSALRTSMEAKISSLEWEQQRVIQIIALFAALVIGFGAITVGIIAFDPDAFLKAPPEPFGSFAAFTRAHPVIMIISFPLIFTLGFAIYLRVFAIDRFFVSIKRIYFMSFSFLTPSLIYVLALVASAGIIIISMWFGIWVLFYGMG